MSDSEAENSAADVVPMPKFRVRFTDMPLNVCEAVVRICEATNKKHSLDKLVATEIQG